MPEYEEAIDPSTGQIIMVPVLEEPAETQDIQQAQQTQTQPPLVVSPTGEYTEVIDPITGLPMPVPILPPGYTPPAEQPPAQTINYPTVDDWRKAGSPSTTPDTRITIGEGGESGAIVTNPETGQKTVVPFAQYKPEEASTYIPTAETYQTNLNNYNSQLIGFEDKWKSYIQNNTFIGDDEQYNSYLADLSSLESRQESLELEYQRLINIYGKERTKQINWEQELKESDPKLYELYKYQPDKYNAEIQRIKESYMTLPDGVIVLKKDINNLKESNPVAYDIIINKGLNTYNSEVSNAEQFIKPYIDSNNNIDVIKLSKDTKEDDLEKVEHYINILMDKKNADDVIKIINEYKEKEKIWQDAVDKEIASQYPIDYPGAIEIKKKAFEDEIKGTSWFNDFVTLAKGYPYAQYDVEKFVTQQKENIAKRTSSMPKSIQLPTKIAEKLALGIIMVAPYTYQFSTAVLNIANQDNITGVHTASKELAKSIVQSVKTIPSSIAADPSEAAYYIGLYLVTPELVGKIIKGTVSRSSPYYISNQGMRFSFTTAKTAIADITVKQLLESGKILETDIARAIGKAEEAAFINPKGTALARIGKSNVFIKIEPTPMSKGMGSVLVHATPEKKPFAVETFDVIGKPPEPALFTSLQAAPRFAIQAAKEGSATHPALVMIYTKNGITWFPRNIQNISDINAMTKLGFEYLGSGKAKAGAYPPIKTYSNRFELEAMIAPGTKLYRVKNLHSRLLGWSGAGEFVTTIDGWVMPIYRFAEQGANIPKVTPATIAAMNIQTAIHSIKLMLSRHKKDMIVPQSTADIMAGKSGFNYQLFSGISYSSIERIANEINRIAEISTRVITNPFKRDELYTKKIDKLTYDIIETILRLNPDLERLYKSDMKLFERDYLTTLNRNFSKYYNVPEEYAYSGIDERKEISLPRDLERESVISSRIIREDAERMNDMLRQVRDIIPTSRLIRVPDLQRNINRIPTVPRLELPRGSEREITPRLEPIKETTQKLITIPQDQTEKNKVTEVMYPIAWHQSDIAGWITVYPPYKQSNIKRTIEKPEGAVEVKGQAEAYNTIQSLGGNSNVILDIDGGAFDITISNPTKKPGRKGAIKYRRDKHNSTTHPLTVKGVSFR